MKKFLAFILTLALVMSMSVAAFAEGDELRPSFPNDGDPSGNTSEGEVNVTIQNGSQTVVYKVDVIWDALTFTYDFGAGSTWDPTTHTYTDGTGAGWVVGEECLASASANITVKNHSDAVVYAAAAFAGGQTKVENGVQVDVADTVLELGNAAEEAYADLNNTPTKTIEVTVSKKPDVTTNFTIPGVIVTITTTNANPSQGE